ncbi:MAG: aminoacyl-tRNA hydrolase [Prevotellaceae bacterium]|jgi:PTH1 family peptidyl-tRNA hydrolase|nr:aminoacyl-tRNA hydrolase [Prevotellaceae bacterium]
MKYLIVGLGNIGPEYRATRHNIGFKILDAFAKVSNVVFEDHRYGFTAEVRVKNQTLVLLKPSTFMNLSGIAVRYWLQKEKIELQNMLVLVDDLSLPFGRLRLKPSGTNAGHNGLGSIQDVLGTQNYARLRFGIGSSFPHGGQINFVLGEWTSDEVAALSERIDVAIEIVKSFVLAGTELTMTQYNNK